MTETIDMQRINALQYYVRWLDGEHVHLAMPRDLSSRDTEIGACVGILPFLT